jgi:hypothetical protein
MNDANMKLSLDWYGSVSFSRETHKLGKVSHASISTTLSQWLRVRLISMALK